MVVLKYFRHETVHTLRSSCRRVIDSATANGKLKVIGPLDFGTRTVTTGRYVKTTEESLKKIK